MSKIKLAIVGYGNMGKIHYKAALKNNFCADPLIVELDKDKVDGGVECINFDEFVESYLDKIDGAIISSPSSVHLDNSLPLIAKNIPLLVEKPLTASKPDDNELLDSAIKKGLLLKCGLIELYNPIIQELSEINFENVNFVHIKRHSPKTDITRKLENIILDLTLHDISIIYKVFKPTKVEIMAVDLTKENGVAESAQILLKLDEKFSVFISSSRQDQEKVRMLEIYDEGSVYHCDLKNKFYEVKQSGKIDSVDAKSITESNVLKKVDMLNKPETAEIQLESFIQSIKDNEIDEEHLNIVKNTHELAYKLLDS